jgi:hypothetical protein
MYFGIEIETCFSLVDQKINDSFWASLIYTRLLSSSLLKFHYIDEDYVYSGKKYDEPYYKDVEKKISYTNWNITDDLSISCDDDDDNNIEFYGVEIITPILPYPLGLKTFEIVFDNILFSNNIIYEYDETQGIHINISSIHMNKLSFLKFWWFFEPILLTFVPKERRNNKYAIPLRSRFKDYQDMTANWEEFYSSESTEYKDPKYTALSVKTDRIEVRLVNGGINKEKIINWTKLCFNILFLSISNNIDIDKKYDETKTMQWLFDSNTELESYFLTLQKTYA